MTIPLTGTGGLFTRWGVCAGVFLAEEVWQQSNIPTYETAILNQYQAAIADIGTIVQDTSSAVSSIDSLKTTFVTYAIATASQMTLDDVKLPDSQNATIIAEIIAQMTANSQTIMENTVAATYTAPSEVGADLVVGLIDAQGNPLQYAYAEPIQINCIQDGQGGGQTITPANQSFQAQGAASAPSMTDSTWPQGSGASLGINVFNPDANGTTADYLTNGNFETWSGSPLVATGWTIAVGTPGTTVVQSGARFRGSYSLGITGNGSELTSVTQDVTSFIQPSTAYALCARVSVSSSPAAGVLSIGLGSETIVIDLTAQTTTFSFQSKVFITPERLASSSLFTMALTTALSSGITVHIDDAVIAPINRLGYGPLIGIPPAATPYIIGDQFLLNVTNDYAGKFQTWLWRALGMDQLGLVFPNSAYPTIPDSLITT